MRVSALLTTAAALTSAASAAVLRPRQYPACVGLCIQQEAAAVSCSISDAPCLCNSNAFINQVAVCFAENCSASDANSGVSIGQELCRAIGVTVTIPNAASSALASGASASHASTGGSSAASTPVSQTSAAPASTSAPPTSVAPSTTQAPASASPTGAAAAALNNNVVMAGALALVGTFVTLLL